MAYSDSMIRAIRAQAPLNLEKAHALGAELGVSYRSIIAKAKQLGVEYVSKAPVAKKAHKATKADICQVISARLGCDMSGLEKADYATLDALARLV